MSRRRATGGRFEYHDVSDEESAAPRFASHATAVAELTARGHAPLCRLELASPQHTDLVLCSVMLDGEESTAASFSSGDAGAASRRPSMYVASCLANGTVVETQWRPHLRLLFQLGPSFHFQDVPARRVSAFSAPTLEAVLEVHAALLAREAQRSPPVRWTRANYLRFRRNNLALVRMNHASAALLADLAASLLTLGLIAGLAICRVGWVLGALGAASIVVSQVLFGRPALKWVMAVVVRRFMALHVREQLLRMAESEDDDDR